MIDLESMYGRLPAAMQHLACTLEGVRIRRSRYNTEFRRLLAEAESRNQWSKVQTCDYRDSMLRAYMRQCVKRVPYFRATCAEWGINPDRICTLNDLKSFPILTKQEYVAGGTRMQREATDPRQCITCHTSGTTGGGLHFRMTRSAFRSQWAIWWRYRRWHGIDLRTACAYFGGRSVVPIRQDRGPLWRYDFARRQLLFSGYHMSEQNMPLYIAELRRQRPAWLCGYPSLLALLAGYMVESGYDLGYVPRWITTLAENLLPQQRRLIAKAFGVEPRQHYGMAEGVANISECELGTLHVDEDFSAVEFVPVEGTDSYRLVGTSFLNDATAFVRYDPGDRVSLPAQGACNCGKAGRVVQFIDGRCEDYVITPDGSRVGRLDHVFKDLIHIREAQIVQDTVGEVSIRVVRGAGYCDLDERQLLLEMKKRLGKEMRITIEYVEKLPRSSSGKLRFVVSTVQKGKVGLTAGVY